MTTTLGQLETYMLETRKSKPRLIETFPFLEEQKLDYPSVSLMKRGVRLFLGFRRATLLPSRLYRRDGEFIDNL